MIMNKVLYQNNDRKTETAAIRCRVVVLHLVFIFCFSWPAFSEVDTFGISQLYPTKAGSKLWNSAHWNNGVKRTITYDEDQYDPTGWTEDHSAGTDGFRIDGSGTMTMSGSGPRFHINSLKSSKVPAQFFRDVEFTAYYQRRGKAGENYGGMVAGVRSGPLGHGSSGGNDCDATTYYARFRNDGKWDFEKELRHPGSAYWSGSGYNKQDPLWKGEPLPANRWIGMKYIIYNIKNNSQVRLEVHIDSISNGDPKNGGRWELVGTVTDTGSWPSGDVSGCPYAQNAIILEGHGTLLMRTDGDTAVYKMVSLREISPVATDGADKRNRGVRRFVAAPAVQVVFSDGTSTINGFFTKEKTYSIYTLQGRFLADRGSIPAGALQTKIRALPKGMPKGMPTGMPLGMYILRMSK